MRSLIAAAMLSLGGLAMTASGVVADDDALYAKLKALLPPGPDAALCYARTYDAEHLTQHPKQKVTEVVFSLRYVPLSEEEATIIFNDDGSQGKQDFRYDFTMSANVKGRAETLYASGNCTSAATIGCGVECDGGGVDLEPLAGNEGSILMRLERELSDRIRMTPGCGEEEDAVEIEAGADDKLFKLDKAPAALCQTMQQTLDKALGQ